MKGINPVLAIGIALPVVLIIVLFGVFYIPTLSVNPAYDFIYSNESPNDYYPQYRNTFTVENGTVTLSPQTPAKDQPVKGEMPTLYRYDIKTQASHQISYEEARALKLDAGPASPDGYTVSYEYGGSTGFLFIFGSDGSQSGYVVRKGNAAKRLTGMANVNGYYNQSATFIGWVVE